MRRFISPIALILTLLVSTVAAQSSVVPSRIDIAKTSGGVVSSNSQHASQIGCDIMNKGGNAVDAAVATAFAMAVTWPEAGNIGGGGFMMVAPTDGEVVCVDYRETSPAGTNATTFVKQKNRNDSRMVGVPGTVRGLALAHEKFGKLSWAELVQPAVELAKDGFKVEPFLAESTNSILELAAESEHKLYDELIKCYSHPEGRKWREGDTMKLPELASTLQRIAKNGPDEFYVGETSLRLVEYMKKSNGLISADDLRNYEAVIRPAIVTNFKSHRVYGPPLPSSGGLCISLALRIVNSLGIESDENNVWNSEQIHILAEIMRRVFRERAAHMGDSDFTEIPQFLFSRKFANELASTIRRDVATPSRELAGDIELTEGPYESPQTTHFSIIDKDGMAVSNTYTLEASWGARVIAPQTGFVLNNEMGDFNWYPGYTNLKGRIGTKPNLVAPRKRMLSSMSPTIVKKDGEVVLVCGSPGGRTIINTTFGIIIQRIGFRRSLADSVMAPRFHHQWFPDKLKIERRNNPKSMSMKSILEVKGHDVDLVGSQGAAHCVAVDLTTGLRTGVADWRRGGRAIATDSVEPLTDEIEIESLDGKPLRRPAINPERFAKLDADLILSMEEANANPGDPHKLIWVGRRLGYLWRYKEAINVFSNGIELHPDVPHLYRHRGHRYITVRQFDKAIADLKKAAKLIEGKPDEVEPDGAPNEAGIPVSSLHSNIWYHLGLAYYLKGDYENALSAYQRSLNVSNNNDKKVSTLDWMYMTLKRLDRDDEAEKLLEQVTPEMKLIENFVYHKRLLLYKGVLKPADLVPAKDSPSRDLDLASSGYGVANWYHENGESVKAKQLLEEVTAGKHWSAFGYIAAEVDLQRMKKQK